MNGQAFGLTGVSPKTSACWACTLGVLTYFIHMYAQFGCGARLVIIHVSAQPVTPWVGRISVIGSFFAWSCSVWYGHEAPTDNRPVRRPGSRPTRSSSTS